MTTADRRLELLNEIYSLVREAGEPPHPSIRGVEVYFYRNHWLRLKEIIAELEALS